MKVLEINNKKAYFNVGDETKIILDITKEDILKILKYIYENDDVMFDEYAENQIANEAEKVIYKNLYEKFNDFKTKKESLKNEVEELFDDIEKKYI